MDLKRVQDDLKDDICHHQTLMQQLKKDPLNPTLKLKLKVLQQHIAELGAKQKRILGNLKKSSSIVVKSKIVDHKEPNSQHNGLLGVKNGSDFVKGTLHSSTLQNILPKTSGDVQNPKFTLITIKNSDNRPTSSQNFQGKLAVSDSFPINLSNVSTNSSSSESSTSSTALVVVSAPSSHYVVSNKPTVRAAAELSSAPLSISLSSLVSTGGVVTLAGGWKGPAQTMVGRNNNNSVVDAIGRLLPGKQVQIKVPVVQNSCQNSLIFMQQKASNSQSKSFRLLPKGRHPIPVNQTHSNVGQKFNIPNNQGRMPGLSLLSSKRVPAVIVPNENQQNSQQPCRQVVVRRVGNTTGLTSTAPAPTSVTWKDLSSKTPAIHKPSYVPRKSFPNINNGVGSFQKFRILDGKPQILPKNSNDITSQTPVNSCSIKQGSDKPRNSTLKAVLTSSKSATTSTGLVTYTRLLPGSIPANGFYPIQPKDTKSSPLIKPSFSTSVKTSSFVQIPSSSSFRPVNANDSHRSLEDKAKEEQSRAKLAFLRNIDLVPKEQAEKVRSRRFRKRRVAANPVYSGGMYISNELEAKRHCPDPLIYGLDGVTAPDIIVKRPRGRPRGSTNKLSSPANNPSNRPLSVRGVRSAASSPVTPAHMEEIRQLKGILDIVASASKAVPPAAIGSKKTDKSTQPDTSTTNVVRSSHSIRTVTNSAMLDVRKNQVEENENDEHEDQCATCGRTGEVLMCDTCSKVYHLSCTTPPLSTVPQGMWVCSECKTQFKNFKSEVKWPGIVSVVHSYMAHDEQRETEIADEQEKLILAKKLINGLQMQTKTLTSAVMAKVNLRSKAMKEKQSIQREISEFGGLILNIPDSSVTKGSDE